MDKKEILNTLSKAYNAYLEANYSLYNVLLDNTIKIINSNSLVDDLKGEWLLVKSISYWNNLNKYYQSLKEAYNLLKSKSKVLPNNAYLFGNYYNVFVICNKSKGSIEDNVEILKKMVILFNKLTDGGLGTDTCYLAQMYYYQGNYELAKEYADQAFSEASFNKQYLVTICVVELISNIAKFQMDLKQWEFAKSYLKSIINKEIKTSPVVVMQSQLILWVLDLSLGILHSIPKWIKEGNLGLIATRSGWKNIEHRVLNGCECNALMVQIQYYSYSSNPIKCLNLISLIRECYKIDLLVINAYLSFFEAGCYLQFKDYESMNVAIQEGLDIIIPNGLWNIAFEFIESFGNYLTKVISQRAPEYSKYCENNGNEYLIKLKKFRLEEMKNITISLTQRERDVLEEAKNGLSNDEIANKLGLSVNTVKTHLKNAFDKLGIDKRTKIDKVINRVVLRRVAEWTKKSKSKK